MHRTDSQSSNYDFLCNTPTAAHVRSGVKQFVLSWNNDETPRPSYPSLALRQFCWKLTLWVPDYIMHLQNMETFMRFSSFFLFHCHEKLLYLYFTYCCVELLRRAFFFFSGCSAEIILCPLSHVWQKWQLYEPRSENHTCSHLHSLQKILFIIFILSRKLLPFLQFVEREW